jgi:phosphatidylcholine synthase
MLRPMAGGVAAAWAVHLVTASGAVLAWLAGLAVIEHDYRAAFLWLAGALLVDAADGWLARLARVKERLPGFNGARLDDLVDYLTFVFVPVLLLYRSGALPEGLGTAIAAAILLSSAYGFSREDAKTADFFFTGFPSYWNVVALYLHAGGTRPGVNAIVLLVLCGLVFVPTGYVYPSRTPVLRGLTVALALAWGALLLAVILRLPAKSPALLGVSLLFPVYYAVLSVVLHRRRA